MELQPNRAAPAPQHCTLHNMQCMHMCTVRTESGCAAILAESVILFRGSLLKRYIPYGVYKLLIGQTEVIFLQSFKIGCRDIGDKYFSLSSSVKT